MEIDPTRRAVLPASLGKLDPGRLAFAHRILETTYKATTDPRSRRVLRRGIVRLGRLMRAVTHLHESPGAEK